MLKMSRFASRLLPARPDLAAYALEGLIDAPRYAVGTLRRVRAPLLDLTATPDAQAERATQLLFGESFTVYAEEDGFAWGQCGADGYVGYVPAEGLGDPLPDDRHVTALLAHLYPEPSIKCRPLTALPFGSAVAVAAEANGFARVVGGGYLALPHLAPVPGDFVTQAERFLGAPYLWGGRSSAGLDCSALVQLALAAVAVRAPRDSDMQAAFVGVEIEQGTPAERGDLVFWKGHVGIVAGENALLHANAHAMAVAREPLSSAISRIAASGGGPVTAIRRGAASRPDWPACVFPDPSAGQ